VGSKFCLIYRDKSLIKKKANKFRRRTMTKAERETVINFNDDEQVASIATRQKRVKTRFQKLGVEPTRKQGDYVCYMVPKSWIKISPPKQVSENQRKAARKNIINARNSLPSLG
jgi:hypothetical protein